MTKDKNFEKKYFEAALCVDTMDLATALCGIAGNDENIREVEEFIARLKAMAENPYNPDSSRIFFATFVQAMDNALDAENALIMQIRREVKALKEDNKLPNDLIMTAGQEKQLAREIRKGKGDVNAGPILGDAILHLLGEAGSGSAAYPSADEQTYLRMSDQYLAEDIKERVSQMIIGGELPRCFILVESTLWDIVDVFRQTEDSNVAYNDTLEQAIKVVLYGRKDAKKAM